MWFAEPAHPYDDPDDPNEWAWRRGHFELTYTVSLKTLTLARGPKQSCQRCHGNGHLPWWERPAEESSDPPRRCPQCPIRRILCEKVPLWPVVTIERLRTWRWRRRVLRNARNAASTDPWHAPGHDLTEDQGGYSDEPPF